MIGRIRPTRGRREEGAAAVEFAILVPLLLIITFGIIAVGLVLWSQITATHAAREAVRRIAVNEETFTNCAAVQAYLETKTGFTPEQLSVTPAGAGVGDEITLEFNVPTNESSVSTFAAVTALVPGGSVIFPDELPVSANGRIEETGPITTTGCAP